jgi:hypothetical protein
MNVNDAVKLALLIIGWRDREADIQPDCTQNRSGNRKPGNHFSGQAVKSGGG